MIVQLEPFMTVAYDWNQRLAGFFFVILVSRQFSELFLMILIILGFITGRFIYMV